METKLLINEKIGEISLKINEPEDPEYILILAHGAGAGMSHSFLENLATQFSTFGAMVVRFNFPYMEAGKKLPGSPRPNLTSIGAVINWVESKYHDLPLFLSGKSYGGRMSSHWVHDNTENAIKGLIYFGFPLHAPGKPSKNRATHLYEIKIPQFFIQGTRDALADIDLIREVILDCPKAEHHIIENADHSFKIPKKLSKLTHQEIIEQITDATSNWVRRQIE